MSSPQLATRWSPVRSDPSFDMFSLIIRWLGKLQRMPRHQPWDLGTWAPMTCSKLSATMDGDLGWDGTLDPNGHENGLYMGGGPINTYFKITLSGDKSSIRRRVWFIPNKRTWQNSPLRKLAANLPPEKESIGNHFNKDAFCCLPVPSIFEGRQAVSFQGR